LTTPAQLALAWTSSRGDHIIPLPGYSTKERALENLAACDIVLSAEEIQAIDEVLAAMPPKGGRGVDGKDKIFMLWG
jgi:pyridoxine 4-dehydrogenase